MITVIANLGLVFKTIVCKEGLVNGLGCTQLSVPCA